MDYGKFSTPANGGLGGGGTFNYLVLTVVFKGCSYELGQLT